MSDEYIKQLATKFRTAIEAARDDGVFDHDISFYKFPQNCCGDTSYLLAEYLRKEAGIETIWYSAERGDWSHAWLVVKDGRLKAPTPKSYMPPENIKVILEGYGVVQAEQNYDITRYETEDLQDGLIVDITADQFLDYDIPVYVGLTDSFHQSFRFIQAHECESLYDVRIRSLYCDIINYLDD